jgi:hypothetical protein
VSVREMCWDRMHDLLAEELSSGDEAATLWEVSVRNVVPTLTSSKR